MRRVSRSTLKSSADLCARKMLVPTSSWPESGKEKLIGHYSQSDSIQALDSVSPKMLQSAGKSEDEIQELLPRVRREFLDGNVRAYSVWVVVYGRKPLTASGGQ
jgi:hypothetical protein